MHKTSGPPQAHPHMAWSYLPVKYAALDVKDLWPSSETSSHNALCHGKAADRGRASTFRIKSGMRRESVRGRHLGVTGVSRRDRRGRTQGNGESVLRKSLHRPTICPLRRSRRATVGRASHAERCCVSVHSKRVRTLCALLSPSRSCEPSQARCTGDAPRTGTRCVVQAS